MPEGVTVAITEVYETSVDIEIWQEETRDNRSIASFKSEPCVNTYGSKEQIACSASGKSSLAGTTYVGRPYNGSCERGDPAVVYTCVAGCSNGSKAPRILTKGYWEC